MLTDDDRIRYKRQILFPAFGEEGQKRLNDSHVVVAGVGGLGSLASIYLVCAGIGHVTIVDNDCVELSNLNRQILHWDEDIGERKITSAKRKLSRLNPTVEVASFPEKITEANVSELINGAQAVIDGTDNFETRFILNSSCVKKGIPFIHGGVRGLTGEITTIIPRKGPCLACIYPEPFEIEEPLPVFGVTPAVIAALQVTETIKLIADFGTLLTGRMLFVDGATMEFSFIDLTRDPSCNVCGLS